MGYENGIWGWGRDKEMRNGCKFEMGMELRMDMGNGQNGDEMG